MQCSHAHKYWSAQPIARASTRAQASQPTANAPAKMTSISDFSPAYEDSIFLVCLEFIHPVSIERSQPSLTDNFCQLLMPRSGFVERHAY